MPTIPWDEIPSDPEAFAPPPAGVYSAACVKATVETTSTDKIMIKREYEITKGPHAGKKFWDQLVDPAGNINAARFFHECLTGHGIAHGSVPSWEALAAKFEGTSVTVTLGQREYEGRVYSDAKNFRLEQASVAPATAGGPPPPPPIG